MDACNTEVCAKCGLECNRDSMSRDVWDWYCEACGRPDSTCFDGDYYADLDWDVAHGL